MQENNPLLLDSQSHLSPQEKKAREKLRELQKNAPIPDDEMLQNLPLFLHRGTLGRMLFLHQLYLKIRHTPGVIMQFGVRWGRDLALFCALRGIYEPYNIPRKIIGFDTFTGFPSVSPQDGGADVIATGALGVTAGYEDYLGEILSAHEALSPRSHLKKYELVKGDAVETLRAYLEQYPETIISLAYFDMDLYEPTKKCLELIRPHLVKNSIVGFDELVCREFPGETVALKEAWGITDYEIMIEPTSGHMAYLVF